MGGSAQHIPQGTPMALITDPDLLAQGVEVTITTGTRQITLNLAGDLSADGVTMQCLYSFLKEE